MQERKPRGFPDAPTSNDKPSLIESAAKARMARVSGMGLSGFQASTMAFVVGGCLALGFFAGSWLDARFATTYWMPIGVFAGLSAGVREMFRSLKSLNAQTLREQKQRADSKREQIENQAKTTTRDHRVLDTHSANEKSEIGTPINVTEPETIRPRIFHVPPPPLASFDVVKDVVENREETQNSARFEAADFNVDELTAKLLDEKPRDDK